MATQNDFGWYIANENNIPPNSGTDESGNINTLLAAVASAGGGVIYFATGSYLLQGPVGVTTSGAGSSIAIVGAGWSLETGGTVFQTDYPFQSSGSQDIFAISSAAGTGGIYIGRIAVDRFSLLQANPTYTTTTASPGFRIPLQNADVMVPVNTTTGTSIPNGAYLVISGLDDTGHALTMYGLLISGSGGSTWTVQNVSEDAPQVHMQKNASVAMMGPTTGATFAVNGASNVHFDEIYTKADFDTIRLGQSGSQSWSDVYVTNCHFDNTIESFAHLVGGGNNLFVKNCHVRGLNNGPYVAGTNIALFVDLSHTSDIASNVNLDLVDVEAYAFGVYFSTSSGTLRDSAFEGVSIDGATGLAGYFLQCTAAQASVHGIRIDAGWATCDNKASNNGSGVVLDAGGFGNLYGIDISAMKFSGSSSGSGVSIVNGSSNVTITGCEIYGSGIGGVSIGGSGASHIVVTGNNLGSVHRTHNGNINGVTIAPVSGNASDIVIYGNQLGGNQTAAVALDARTANCRDIEISSNAMSGYGASGGAITQLGNVGTTSGLVNVNAATNAGYNPVGLPPNQPGVPASGTALLNPFLYDCRVYVYGGNVSQISFVSPAGVPEVTGVTGGEIIVGAGEIIVLGYTSIPSWKWLGL